MWQDCYLLSQRSGVLFPLVLFSFDFFLLYDLNSTKMQVLLDCHQYAMVEGTVCKSIQVVKLLAGARIGQSPPLP